MHSLRGPTRPLRVCSNPMSACMPYEVTEPMGVVIGWGLLPNFWLTALAISQETVGQMHSMKRKGV